MSIQSVQSATDIPRLKMGKVGTQFWSVYVPSSVSPEDAVRIQLEQIDIAHRIIDKYSDDLKFADSVESIKNAREENKIASLLGIEGGHTIVNSLGALRSFYKFGEEVVGEMNRLGMIVDLSHVSPETMSDALDVTKSPVMFSHSSAYALTNHSRNVPDKILKRVAKNNGIVMVTFIPDFVNQKRNIWAQGMTPLWLNATTEKEFEEIEDNYRIKHGSAPLA